MNDIDAEKQKKELEKEASPESTLAFAVRFSKLHYHRAEKSTDAEMAHLTVAAPPSPGWKVGIHPDHVQFYENGHLKRRSP